MSNQYSTGSDYRLGVNVGVDTPPNKQGKVAGYCSCCGHMMIKGERKCTRCLSVKGVVKEAPESKDFSAITWLSGKNG